VAVVVTVTLEPPNLVLNSTNNV